MSNNSMKSQFLGSLRSKETRTKILSFVLFAAVISFVLFQGTKSPVVIMANGEEQKVSTHAKTVGELLEASDINVSQYDKVSPSVDTKIVSGMTIEWEQAKEVIVSVDGKESNVWTTEKVVKNILEEANIEVTEHDKISQSLNTEIEADNKIDIQKAFQLTLVDGLEERQVWSTSTTVANFLKQQGIQLGEFDRVENKLENVITPAEKIVVVRVEKVTDVVEESVDFAVEKKNDSSLLKGKEKVVTEGVAGNVERTYVVVKENGKVVDKKLKSEKVTKEPTTKVVAVGTKVVTASVSRSNAPTGGTEFYVTATAYTPYCNGCSGISAAGINLRSDSDLKLIAVDPSVIPLGTKVWVEGYGYAIAGDTGGAIKGNKIDILVQTKQQAYSWGRKKVRIKVLN
ncbi:G5 and 3D domain-containing protein [Bacillus ndiopicus]|uniref:G5 and 3D domain-containing protein n=1 Tax=Bacillus ndiopicus TaxID=1347368 RepID=UPI0005A6D491|nr:G5 and 3D domain-containing protein [Bacillus ndiopicus]